MSRPPRKMSLTGLYHIIFRGINRQNIFEESEDYKKMIDIIDMVKKSKTFEIYAYCLMTNHVHLFIKEKECGDIKKIMHSILTRYVQWFNYKYQRSGALIGNRYKSEPIEDEKYYFSLIRYIHKNPEKAGLVEKLKDYQWSSYSEYIQEKRKGITDICFLLEMFCEERKKAVKEFISFHEAEDEDCFSLPERKRLTDEQAKNRIKMILKNVDISGLLTMKKEERNRYISMIKEETEISIRQLERLTGISRGIISRIK